VAEIRNYTMNFAFGRASRLTRISCGLACAEIHLRIAVTTALSFDIR
jgi:hypothetical protein